MSQAVPHNTCECRCALCHSWRRVGSFIADPRLGAGTRELATQRLRDLVLDLLDKREEETGSAPVAEGVELEKPPVGKEPPTAKTPEQKEGGDLQVKEELEELTPPAKPREEEQAAPVTEPRASPEEREKKHSSKKESKSKRRNKKDQRKSKKHKKEKKEEKAPQSDTSPAEGRETKEEKEPVPDKAPAERERSDSLDPSSSTGEPDPATPEEREEKEKASSSRKEQSLEPKRKRDSRSRESKKPKKSSRASRSGRREHRSRRRDRSREDRPRLRERPAEPYYPPAPSARYWSPYWGGPPPGNWKSCGPSKGAKKRERAGDISQWGTDSSRKAAREDWYNNYR